MVKIIITSLWPGDPVETVASDVAVIMRIRAEMTLSLSSLLTVMLQTFSRVQNEDPTLLGAPLFPGPAHDRAWAECCEELAKAADRLSAINAQDARIFFRSSFSAPKVLHLLTCSPFCCALSNVFR